MTEKHRSTGDFELNLVITLDGPAQKGAVTHTIRLYLPQQITGSSLAMGCRYSQGRDSRNENNHVVPDILNKGGLQEASRGSF